MTRALELYYMLFYLSVLMNTSPTNGLLTLVDLCPPIYPLHLICRQPVTPLTRGGRYFHNRLSAGIPMEVISNTPRHRCLLAYSA